MLKGAFKHEDNKGHSGTIGPGDIQWMTAGRGIVHSEMPASNGDNVGLQLWVNLSAKDKMTAVRKKRLIASPDASRSIFINICIHAQPQYQELREKDIPTARSPAGDVLVKVVAGKCYGVESAVFTATPTMFWDVRANGGAVFEEKLPASYNAFVYVLEGTVQIGADQKQGEHGTCAILGEGESVIVKAVTEYARFVVISGKPHNEPIVQHGPFVMNTNEEIRQAFRDYSEGKF